MRYINLRRGASVLAGVLAAGLLALPAGAGVTTETADVVGQGPAGLVVSDDGATLKRSASGLSVKLKMPTPAPGTYVYPGPNPLQPWQPLGALFIPGSPEAYSLWVFVFNYPSLCSVPCDSNDLGTTPGTAQGGAFNGGGHIVGGPNLSLAGHVSVNTTPFRGSVLLEPLTAEVHLAVAPHGALQPHVLPDQITKPLGVPAHWWLAFFK